VKRITVDDGEHEMLMFLEASFFLKKESVSNNKQPTSTQLGW
jgi:hypothetical protein